MAGKPLRQELEAASHRDDFLSGSCLASFPTQPRIFCLGVVLPWLNWALLLSLHIHISTL